MQPVPALLARRVLSEETSIDIDAFIGALYEILNYFFNILGKHLFRYAALQGAPATLCQWHYWAGTLLILVGLVPDTVAYFYAPSSIIAACAGMAQAWNCLLAPYTLAEALTVQRLTASLLIIAGTVGAALSGPSKDGTLTRDDYLVLLKSGPAIAFYVLFIVWQALVAYMWLRGPTRLRGSFLAMFAGGFASLYFFQAVAIDLGECLLTTEDTCKDKGGDGYSPWSDQLFWWFLIFAVIFGYCFALGLLALALRSFEALYVISIYETTLIIIGNLCGLFVLGEYDGFTTGGAVGYAFSTAIILGGLLMFLYWPSSLVGDGERAIPMPFADRCHKCRGDPITAGPMESTAGPNEASELLNPKQPVGVDKSYRDDTVIGRWPLPSC